MLIRTTTDREWRAPESTDYQNEDELERLLAETPTLLALDPQDPPLVAVRQVPAAGGAVDLVALSRDGSISVVECKLRRNPEIRRQVVGQLLAYASWFWQMPVDDFLGALRSGIGLDGDPVDAIEARLPEDEELDRDALRARLAANLQTGRFTLVLAVDDITDELRRIVRYLDAKTSGDVKFVAVEFSYVRASDVEVLVPTTYGAELAERRRPARPERREWDEESILAELARVVEDPEVATAQTLIEWMRGHDVGPYFGAGATRGDTYARMRVGGERPMALFAVMTWGKIELHFEELQQLPPFDQAAKRLELRERLLAIPDIGILERHAVEATWPSFPLRLLRSPEHLEAFVVAFDWVVSSIRATRAE